jgi:predicted porin
LYLGTSFADATLYGNIDQTYQSTKTTVGGTVSNQQTSIGSYQMGDSFLGVKGEEDLGGGMKASYLYEFGLKTESNATPTNRQSFVGLSGGFGALRIGKQYSNAFMNAVSADPGGATGGRGALYLYSLVGYDVGADNPLRQDRGFQYDLPSFMPGLKLGFTKTFGNANSAANDGKTVDSNKGTNGVKVGDGQGFNASYSTGGLYVGFTSDTAKGEDILNTKVAGAAIGYDAANTDTNKLTTFALSYNLGMAKPSYLTTKMSAGTATLKTDMFALNVPLGAATVFISSSTGKLDVSGTAGDLKMKGMQYGVNYALSKRTVAYWHAGNETVTFSSSGTAAKTTGFGLGVHHSF